MTFFLGTNTIAGTAMPLSRAFLISFAGLAPEAMTLLLLAEPNTTYLPAYFAPAINAPCLLDVFLFMPIKYNRFLPKNKSKSYANTAFSPYHFLPTITAPKPNSKRNQKSSGRIFLY